MIMKLVQQSYIFDHSIGIAWLKPGLDCDSFYLQPVDKINCPSAVNELPDTLLCCHPSSRLWLQDDIED